MGRKTGNILQGIGTALGGIGGSLLQYDQLQEQKERARQQAELLAQRQEALEAQKKQQQFKGQLMFTKLFDDTLNNMGKFNDDKARKVFWDRKTPQLQKAAELAGLPFNPEEMRETALTQGEKIHSTFTTLQTSIGAFMQNPEQFGVDKLHNIYAENIGTLPAPFSNIITEGFQQAAESYQQQQQAQIKRRQALEDFEARERIKAGYKGQAGGAPKDIEDLIAAGRTINELKTNWATAYDKIQGGLDKLPDPISKTVKSAMESGVIPEIAADNPIAKALVPELNSFFGLKEVAAVQYAKVFDSGNIPEDMIKRYKEGALPRLLTNKDSAMALFDTIEQMVKKAKELGVDIERANKDDAYKASLPPEYKKFAKQQFEKLTGAELKEQDKNMTGEKDQASKAKALLDKWKLDKKPTTREEFGGVD